MMTMRFKAKGDGAPRHRRQCPAILLLVRRILLILQLVLVFVCEFRSNQRQLFCVVDAFGVGGVVDGARPRTAIPRLGNSILPSPATKRTEGFISSATLDIINNHHTCHHRRRYCDRATAIQMSANQQHQQHQDEQVQQHRLVKISSISSPDILDNYDTFLLDMWGGKDFHMHEFVVQIWRFVRSLTSPHKSLQRILRTAYSILHTVMHNGKEPYDGVIQAIQGLKKAGKKLIILSNSSKRRDNSEDMLIKRELMNLPLLYDMFLFRFYIWTQFILCLKIHSWIRPLGLW